MSTSDLLPGEAQVATFGGSHRVRAADWGVRAVGGGPFARAFGIKGMEVVGGTLQLTSWRLIFTARPANRFIGSLSVGLSDITGVERVATGLTRAITVTGPDGPLVFSTWNADRFIDALEAARAELTGPELERCREALAAAPAPADPFGLRR